MSRLPRSWYHEGHMPNILGKPSNYNTLLQQVQTYNWVLEDHFIFHLWIGLLVRRHHRRYSASLAKPSFHQNGNQQPQPKRTCNLEKKPKQKKGRCRRESTPATSNAGKVGGDRVQTCSRAYSIAILYLYGSGGRSLARNELQVCRGGKTRWILCANLLSCEPDRICRHVSVLNNARLLLLRSRRSLPLARAPLCGSNQCNLGSKPGPDEIGPCILRHQPLQSPL